MFSAYDFHTPLLKKLHVTQFWRRFVMWRFAIIAVLKTQGQKYKHLYIYILNMQLSTGCDVKEQLSQSEVSDIPIYHLSQSALRPIKLLKQVMPRLREVRWSQVNVRGKKGTILNQGLHRISKNLCITPRSEKKSLQGPYSGSYKKAFSFRSPNIPK
jgi:hypothetical protein